MRRFLLVSAILVSLLPSAPWAAQSILTVAGGANVDGRPATSVGFRHVDDVAVDSSGRIYFVNGDESRVRMIDPADGILRTFAGTGSNGFTGDGGPANEAQMATTGWLHISSTGTMYIGSFGNLRIVNLETGIIRTLTYVDLPQEERAFNSTTGMATDNAGRLYAVDRQFHRVVRVDETTRAFEVVAGNGQQGYSGDGGPGHLASLDTPSSILVVGNRLLISDSRNHVIRSVDLTSGIIDTFAGTGSRGFSGDGGPATSAQFAFLDERGSEPYIIGLAADASGNVFVSDPFNQRIRRIAATSGVITTLIDGTQEPVEASAPRLGTSTGLAFDPTSNSLIICNGGELLRFHFPTARLTRLAGGGAQATGDGGPALSAIIPGLTTIAFDRRRGILVGDVADGNRIRRVDLATRTIDTILGGGSEPIAPGVDPRAAHLDVPEGLAIDGSGVVYILVGEAPRIYSFNPANDTIALVAGNGELGFTPDGELAAGNPINTKPSECCFEPLGIVVDSSGNIYFSDSGNRRVRRIDNATGRLTTVAGDGGTVTGGDGGPATEASINYPTALALDPSERYLYVTETVNFAGATPDSSYSVRRIDLESGVITRFAGMGVPGNHGPDGVRADESAIYPGALAIRDDALLIHDSSRLRSVDLETNIITTIAGTASENNPFGDYGPASESQVVVVPGIAVDPATGDIAIADDGSNRVRLIPACRDEIAAAAPLAPADGSSAVGTAPRLSWSPVDGAFAYDVFFDSSGATTLVVADTRQTFYTLSNLTPGTTYQWKVVAKGDPFCPSLVTSSSPVFSFTTVGGCNAPGGFSLTFPPAGQIVNGTAAILEWTSSPGAASYDVFFGTSNPPPFAGTTSSLTFPASGLLSGASYFWKVIARASCNTSLTTSSETRSFVVSGGSSCLPPGDFTSTAPANGAADVALSVSLSWSASPNATSYDIFFGTTTPPPLYLPGLAATTQTISSLRASMTYYWSVRARTGCSSATSATPIASFTTQSACLTPGAPAILFSPPGAVASGQTYVIVWSPASDLEADGFYLVERATDAAFTTNVESQLVEATAASFLASAVGTFHHRVRAVPVCDVTKAGPFSVPVTVNVAAGAPNVIFTVHPPGVVSSLGQPIEDKRASFTLENIGDTAVDVIMTTARIASPDFFSVHDPLGSDGVFVRLEPRQPHTFDLRFSGPPNDAAASYQGVIVVNVPGSSVIPYAFVNLKVGGAAGATPEIILGDAPASWVAFPGFDGSSDATRQPISIFVRNPGTAPMELAAEIGPEAWLVPESGWNAQPIAPGGVRELKLFTNRRRAPNGSPLPRYTYLTLRTRTGESARILVQDNDVPRPGDVRGRLAPDERSYLVPDLLADRSVHGIVSVVRLTNAGSDVVQATLHFTPRGADGFSAEVRSATVVVPANDVVVLTDPLGQVFGIEGDAAGQLEVRAAPERIGLLSVSSTLVDQRSTELVLASLPTLWRGEGARLGATLVVPGVTSHATQRSELVLAETLGADRSTVVVRLLDSGGNLLGRRTIEVPRYGQAVLPDISSGMAGGAALSAARVEIALASGGGAVVPLVKIVDRTTRSAAILVGQPSEGASSSKQAAMARLQRSVRADGANSTSATWVVPFVSAGAFGTSSATSTLLGLTSPLATPVDVTLTFRNSATGQAQTSTVTLPPGTSREFANVLLEVFGLSGALRGTLTVSADRSVRVHSRSLAAPVGSSAAAASGQNSVVALDSTLLSGASANLRRLLILDGINQSIDPSGGSRWSVFVSELTGQTAAINVRIYEAGNRKLPIATKNFTIPGFAVLPLDTLFERMDLDMDSRRKNRANMLCVIEPRSGTGIFTAVAIEQSSVNGTLRTHSFQPVAGTPATGTQLSTGTEVPEVPERKRPARR